MELPQGETVVERLIKSFLPGCIPENFTSLAAKISYAGHTVLITCSTQIPTDRSNAIGGLQLKLSRHHQFVDFKIPPDLVQ